jgi:hypothetical protein
MISLCNALVLLSQDDFLFFIVTDKMRIHLWISKNHRASSTQYSFISEHRYLCIYMYNLYRYVCIYLYPNLKINSH